MVRFFVDPGAAVNESESDTVELEERFSYPNTMKPNLFMMRWALTRSSAEYFVRMDDDNYLCPENLLKFIDVVVAYNYTNCFVGNFYLDNNVARADENFQLYSRSFAQFLAHGLASGLLPHADDVTFARNIAYWVALTEVSVIDSHELFVNNNALVDFVRHAPCQNACAKHVCMHPIKNESTFECIDALSGNESLSFALLHHHVERIADEANSLYKHHHDDLVGHLPRISKTIDDIEI